MSATILLILAALLGAEGVALGAFGAHYLKERLSDYALGVFETGIRYQFYHLFALMACGWLSATGTGSCFSWAGWAFVIGILLFSGSLYMIAFTGVRTWGMVTPVGGLILIIGWLIMAAGFWGRH